ncbi:MAG: squalene/phytoene synthase family protein [Myxococcaceae bacterium]|nr:squalene/phytoene synthase family protein [Myxococcaceae bacterium]
MPSWSGYAPWADTVDACREEFVQVARRFWLIPELIPPIDRDDVGLLYCFCRRLDDAVDEAPGPEAARAALEAWRDELEGRAPARPLIAAFVAGAARSGLPLSSARHLLDGMAADLGVVRLADDAALVRYAYQVSSSVGLMLAPLLGVRGVEGERRVVDLGVGLQLSNVLLGVADDARRGRVYLPATRLSSVGLSANDVLARPDDARLKPVLRGLADLADRYYASAELGAATVPLRYRHGVMLLGRAYGTLGRRAADGLPAPLAPAGLPVSERLAHLAALAVAGVHPRVLGFVAAPPHEAVLHRDLAGLPGAHA